MAVPRTLRSMARTSRSQRNFRYYGAKFESRTDGLTDAYAALEAIPEAFREVLVDAIEKGSGIIESEAHGRVPIKEGDLDRSIGRNIREDGLQAAVGSGLEYASFVELGTHRQRAQPWLYPSYLIGARFVRRKMRESGDVAGQKIRVRSRGRRRRRRSR